MVTIPNEVLSWQFGGKTGNLMSQKSLLSASNGYNLLQRDNNRFLTYDKGNLLGIDLGYTADPENKRIHFRLPDGTEREILTGEPVAFGLGGAPSFLQYATQPVGINLKYVHNPTFEWRILDGTGNVGVPVSLGSWVAIINDRAEDFLVHFERPGGDIGWTSSVPWYDNPLFRQAVQAAVAAILAAV
jgi:hypothetical protein